MDTFSKFLSVVEVKWLAVDKTRLIAFSYISSSQSKC